VLASVPQAAAAYVLLLVAGGVAGLMRSDIALHGPLSGMVLLYGLLLCGTVFTTARIYTARLVSEREAERQREWVGLLLRDFEQHSADLLWEIDATGRFSRGSARLAAALTGGSEALGTDRLLDALAAHAPPELGPQHRLELAAAVAEGHPFRDLAVPVQTDRGLRWWSFTATPMIDDAGRASGWRGVMSDVTPARRAQDRLEQLAHCDSLTGLANRLQLRERSLLVPVASGSASEPARRVALICLDVDHFKTINDTQGHVVGDAVLVEIARRLRSSLRAADLAVRMGGDEFALVIDPLHDDDQVHGLARRLVKVLGQPIEVAGQLVPLSVSVGVAIAPDHGRTLDELLVNADLALYAAKDSGRGRYEVFSSRLGDRHRRKVQIAQALRGALSREEFVLAWQPQVRIADWRVVGVEVLLRWQHPELGLVSPADFIPVAEESGLIGDIGAWVLQQACTGAAELPETVAVSVNASPAQLMREDFVPAVVQALARSGLPAGRLKIEITESLFMDATPVTLSNLHALRELGLQIALDDFGTGFSSLAYLLRFPFDLLKIDRAFVLEMMARDDARALVRTIVEMARSLGMKTVAEGVEDQAQLEVLGAAGCDAVQGYLVARPMPLAQLHQLLQAWRERPAAAPAEPADAVDPEEAVPAL